MIPTIRSMIIALLLTVTVLVGGFGLFAAFRVNHEPLARLPVAATPFQLTSIDSAPRAMSFASDQPRLEANEGLRAVATAMSAREPDQKDAPVDDGADQTASVPERVATVPGPSAIDLPSKLVSSSAPADVAAAPSPDAAAPQATDAAAPASAQQQIAAVSAATPEPAQPDAATAAATAPLETAQPQAKMIVTGSIAELPPQDVAALTTVTPVDPQDTARQIANRKRLAALRRARRARLARAQAANETTGFGQANFPSSFQSAQSGAAESFGAPARASRRPN